MYARGREIRGLEFEVYVDVLAFGMLRASERLLAGDWVFSEGW